MDADIEDLSVREFNARYPLQAKRQLAVKQSGGKGETDAIEEKDTSKRSARKQEIFKMVRNTLEQNPEASPEELQERAAKIDPSIADLSTRSFHARYPLQVKRRMNAEQKSANLKRRAQ